jgi:hypothetical protein
LQFVTTNFPSQGRQADVQFIDNAQRPTPFYDVAGFTADATGFADLPARPVQNAAMYWTADLFLVQEVPNGSGGTAEVIWDGLRWGWTTGAVAPAVNSVAPNTGTTAGGNQVIIRGAGFTGATNVSFGGVPASAYTVQSDGWVTATVPASAIGTVDVVVTTPAGPSPTTSSDLYSYINGAPCGANKTVATPENIAYTFATADFGFSDPMDSPANSLKAVNITTLPTVGLLTDYGAAVTAGESINAIDISVGALVYTPAAYTIGSPADSFTFQVQDNGGTWNGGIDTDPIARSMSINVTAPVVTLTNPGNQTNTAGDTVTLPLVASASNGDLVSLSATGLPAGLSIAGGAIAGTIASNAGSSTPYTVTITATDALANVSASVSFTWTVNPPAVTVTLSNPGGQTSTAGNTVSLPLMAYVSNGDLPTYSAAGLPAGLTISNGAISGTIASDAGSSTPYTVTITATDPLTGVSATQTFTWTVNPSTETITFTNPGNQATTPGGTVLLPLMGYASNGDMLTYSGVYDGDCG